MNTKNHEDRWTSFNDKRYPNASALLSPVVTISAVKGFQAMPSRRCGEVAGSRLLRKPTCTLWETPDYTSGQPPPHTTVRIIQGETGLFQASGAPTWRADHSRVKQRVLMPIGSKGHVPPIRFAALLNIDAQDRQDEQDKTLRHRKRTGWMIEWAFVGNLKVLRGPSPTPFESFPTSWSPLADSSFAPVTDPLAPLVEICSAFPTFGGSLLSFLQPLRGFLFFLCG